MLHFSKARSWFMVILVLAALVGCGDRQSLTPTASSPNPNANPTPPDPLSPASDPTPTESISVTTAPSTNAPSTNAPALALGQYCYTTQTQTLSQALRLNLAADGSVTGDSVATVQNDAAAYYTSYRQQFSGQLSANQLAANITTWIEYDVQKTTATWRVTADQIKTDRETLTAVDCATVKERFAGPNGLEANDLLDGAQNVHRQVVQFEPGASSAVLEGAVVRGDRDLYILGAQGGQTMNLAIASTEDNAVFDVVSPNGTILLTEASNQQVPLPTTGDYQVIVGGTRGNATYKLTVEIR